MFHVTLTGITFIFHIWYLQGTLHWGVSFTDQQRVLPGMQVPHALLLELSTYCNTEFLTEFH